MGKSSTGRLNATLDQIDEYKNSLFQGFNTTAIRKILIRKIENHFDVDRLSTLLSFGGVRVIRVDSDKTEARHLKRLTLLFHRVLGYHSEQETEALKRTIEKLSTQQMMLVAKQHIDYGLKFLTDQKLWANEISAKHAGRLLRYYNQGEDKRLSHIDMTENGWCLGMSVQWLGAKATMTDFWDKHETEAGAAQYRFVMAGQKMRTGGLHGASTDDRAAFRLKRFGMTKAAKTESAPNPPAITLARALTGSPTQYCRIGQYYRSGGGHAMAAIQRDGGILFLDPNCGEFFFNSGAGFEQWFEKFCVRMDYAFKSHYVEHFNHNRAEVDPEVVDAMAARRKAMGYDDDED